MEKDLTVIIVNFKSKEYLERCLGSIKEKFIGINYEIIIVNNDDREKITGETFRGVNVIENANRGFGSGSNLGARKASGRILMFLNPDARILSGDVRRVLSEFENEKIGIIGSRLLTSRLDVQSWCAGYKLTISELLRNNFGALRSRRLWDSSKKIKVDWVSAAALFIPRKFFLEIGGFDENIFMYLEDMDLCLKAGKKGKKVVYDPGFSVMHLGGKSHQEEGRQKKYYYDSLEYYFQKHHGTVQAKIIKILRLLLRK